MKKIISILFLAIMALGCSKEEQTPNTALQNADSFNVSVEQTGTKTTVNENYQIIWSEGDKISVFPTTESNHEYSYGGFEESTSAKFYKTSDDQETGTPLNAFYGIYPYNASTSVSANGKITLTLPAEQQYAYNSFAPGTNTMVAVSSGTNDKNLAFKSICGFIRIRLYGNAVISSIELKGNRNETISGTTTVTASSSTDPEVQIAGGNNAGTAITLKCPDEGIAIGAIKDKATSFWFTVPPVTFEEGFTITVETTEGTIRTKTTDKQYTVNRNELKTMEAVLISEDQPNNEIWYTTTDGNPIQLGSTDGFGSTFVEHTYANGKGKIKFAGEVKTIPDYRFYSKDNLQTVSLPESITSLGTHSTFAECINLTEINLPSRLTILGNWTFYKCKNLSTEIIIPSGVTSISDGVFCGCSKLPNVTLHDNITSFGPNCFEGCSAIKEINMPTGLTSIGANAFKNCVGIENKITIANQNTSIGSFAFEGCTNLPSIVLPANLTTIAEGTFLYCSKLNSVTIPDNVTTIGVNAFNGTPISEISIPVKVTYIGYNAFDCANLTTVYCLPTTPPILGTYGSILYPFGGKSNLKFYVPAASVDVYKIANVWKKFADRIEAMPAATP